MDIDSFNSVFSMLLCEISISKYTNDNNLYGIGKNIDLLKEKQLEIWE